MSLRISNLSLLAFTMIHLAIFAGPGEILTKSEELEACLLSTWGVDRHTTRYLMNKFTPFLEDPSYSTFIDDFINKSNALVPNFSEQKKPSCVHAEDGVLQAPEQHLIIFENPWIRVLLGSTQPDTCENLHIHVWKSILVIIRSTTFEITYADGTVVTEEYPIGVYELPAMEKYACKNIGTTADECLRFEIKG